MDLGSYVKPIQATPTLTGNDTVNIIKQVLKYISGGPLI